MDQIVIHHEEQDWYLRFVTRSAGDHTQVHVRSLESMSNSAHRINVPVYKQEEVRQQLQNQFGPQTEVLFV